MERRDISLRALSESAGKWGLYGGIILAVFSASIYIFDVNIYNVWFGLISFLLTYGISIVFMYKAAVAFRDKNGPGKIDYFSGLVVLFVAGIIIFFISAFFNLILNTVIDPEYHVELFRQFEEFIRSNQNIPENMVDELLVKTKENLDPMKQLKTSLITSPVIAIILSLIMAFFVRKNPRYQENL